MERLIRRSRSRGGNAGCTQIPSEQRVRTQMYAIIARAVHFRSRIQGCLSSKGPGGRPALNGLGAPDPAAATASLCRGRNNGGKAEARLEHIKYLRLLGF